MKESADLLLLTGKGMDEPADILCLTGKGMWKSRGTRNKARGIPYIYIARVRKAYKGAPEGYLLIKTQSSKAKTSQDD